MRRATHPGADLLAGRLRASECSRMADAAVPRASGAIRTDVVAQVARGVAHEFNDLLTAIAGSVAIVRAEPGLPDAVRTSLGEIEDATARATQLARRLLVLSGGQTLEPRLIDVREFLGDLAPTLSSLAAPIPVTVALGADASWRVNVDPARLRQVLELVVQRAVSALAGSSRGRVGMSVATRRVELLGEPRASAAWPAFVAITVEDNGPALAPEARARLFEPSVAGDALEEAGGLATAYGLVRDGGGMLEARSVAGEGTTITVLLPQVIASDAELPGRLRDPSSTQRRTILVVEDEESVQRFVRIILEREGYRVLLASHGVAALQLLEEPDLSVDVLLTDLMMPQMGGRELAERMLAVQPDVIVVFMSGYVADRSTLTGVVERRAPYLQKPFTIHELLHVIRVAIDRADA